MFKMLKTTAIAVPFSPCKPTGIAISVRAPPSGFKPRRQICVRK